ncbi:hypothetical protein HanHA89_Chr16g0678271 [Helianthus annuus]|nr:hypothetical protein HanHA89_Chr16g0678271 [Helianthus annuus]
MLQRSCRRSFLFLQSCRKTFGSDFCFFSSPVRLLGQFHNLGTGAILIHLQFSDSRFHQHLGNKMADEYLTNSLVIYIEKEIADKFDSEDITDEFKNLKGRRAELSSSLQPTSSRLLSPSK